MYLLVIILFVVGYSAIVFEHPLHLNKTAPALLTGTLCWAAVMLAPIPPDLLQYAGFQTFATAHPALAGHELYADYMLHHLREHLGEIAEILFFLMGAMTIVELVDAHGGFKIITDRIQTRDARKLLWIICTVAFFMSALLDNLTTSIVMVTLLRKLIAQRERRIFFVGMVVIAANAGGAWSPIGDVTTTMLLDWRTDYKS